jgi:hypothetical protein
MNKRDNGGRTNISNIFYSEKRDDVGYSGNKYGGTLEKKCSRNGIKFTVSNRTLSQ